VLQPPSYKAGRGLLLLMMLTTLAWPGPTAASVGPKLLAGCQLVRQGELDSAARQFEAAYQQDSRCAQARAGLGTVHLLLAAALDPNSSLGGLGLVAAYCQLGDDQAGLKSCEKLLEDELSAADRTEVTGALAYLQCRQGLYDSALAAAGRVLAAEPTHTLACYVEAAALLAKQQFADAADAIEPPLAGPALFGLLVNDCLFAPEAYYAQKHPILETVPEKSFSTRSRISRLPGRVMARRYPKSCASAWRPKERCRLAMWRCWLGRSLSG